MVNYHQKFDAKAYWATKPLCTICKSHKVKRGTVCYECKKKAMEKEKKTIDDKTVKNDYFKYIIISMATLIIIILIILFSRKQNKKESTK